MRGTGGVNGRTGDRSVMGSRAGESDGSSARVVGMPLGQILGAVAEGGLAEISAGSGFSSASDVTGTGDRSAAARTGEALPSSVVVEGEPEDTSIGGTSVGDPSIDGASGGGTAARGAAGPSAAFFEASGDGAVSGDDGSVPVAERGSGLS
jgi:hypothetical protein